MSDESLLMTALDLAEAGKWQEAHEVVQLRHDPAASWVHACLHREEGDEENARYWYSKAGKPPATGSLANERNEIRRALSADQSERPEPPDASLDVSSKKSKRQPPPDLRL